MQTSFESQYLTHFKLLHNKENEKEIKYSATADFLVCLLFYCTTSLLSFLILKDPFYNSLSQLPIFPISSSSSSCCFICKNRLWLIFANEFLFHRLQFSFNLFQYSCSYFISPHPYNNFAMYFPGSSLLNAFLSSSVSCCLASSSSALPYSFSNSFTNSLAFLRFSLLSQVFSSAVHPFHHTRYFSLPHTHLLFIIFFTFHSSSSITTSCGVSFLCPFTYPIYLLTLLTLTTRCIFTVLGSSNSIAFVKTIDLTL